MTDLIDGLGGPAGFGEVRARGDAFSTGPIDLTPVFPLGVTWFGRRYDQAWINVIGSVTFDGPALSDSEDQREGSLGIYPFETFLGTARDPVAASPGGTSRGTNAVWYDLDPQAGAFTVTWDDVRPEEDGGGATAAFQLRLIDISDEPGAASGDIRIELRYEEVGWVDSGSFNPAVPFIGYVGEAAGRGGVFRERIVPETEAAHFALEGAEPLIFEIGATGLGGGRRAPIRRDPDHTPSLGDERLAGTDEADLILPGPGPALTVLPGLGADRIGLGGSATIVAGTPEELSGDTLVRAGWDDVLLFYGVDFTADQVGLFDGGGLSLFVSNRSAGEPEVPLDLPGPVPSGRFVTLDHFLGTFLAYLRDLPPLEEGRAVGRPERLVGDDVTAAYLRSDGISDYLVRLEAPLPEGVAVGAYSVDPQGRLVGAELLDLADGTAVVEGPEVGDRVGFFVVAPEEAALRDADGFAFVDRGGAPATVGGTPPLLVTRNGEIVSEDVIHGPLHRLNPDGQRALIGAATDGPGLGLAFETGPLAGADFADVVLGIERVQDDLF
jgi:hypothetical protein